VGLAVLALLLALRALPLLAQTARATALADLDRLPEAVGTRKHLTILALALPGVAVSERRTLPTGALLASPALTVALATAVCRTRILCLSAVAAVVPALGSAVFWTRARGLGIIALPVRTIRAYYRGLAVAACIAIFFHPTASAFATAAVSPALLALAGGGAACPAVEAKLLVPAAVEVVTAVLALVAAVGSAVATRAL
jgi:hypothetical protein